MSRHNSIMFLCAGVIAALAACHQARPAASAYQVQQTETVGREDRSAREAIGYAPTAKQPQRELTSRSPGAAPAPAPISPDDPMRLFDMP